MRFDELASRAGEHAAGVGRRVGRPSFAQLVGKRRRHMLVIAWSAASVVAVAMLGGVLLSTKAGSEPPLAAAPATTELITTTLSEEPIQPALGREECPITFPGDAPFTPPTERELTLSFEGAVWYGTPALWTFVQEGGQVWEDLPVSADGSLTQKTFWWTEEYVSSIEPVPEIGFYAEDVGGSAATVEAEQVTSGGHPEMGVFIIAGFEIPQGGCWRITARHQEASVGYVAWVEGR